MKYRYDSRLILRSLTGELTEAENERLQQRLYDDPRLRNRHDDYKAVWHLSGKVLPEVDAQSEIEWLMLSDRLQEGPAPGCEKKRPAGYRTNQLPRSKQFVTTILLLLLASLWLLSIKPGKTKTDVVPQQARFVFQQATLDEVAVEIENFFDVSVAVADALIEPYREELMVTGVYEGESIEAIVAEICKAAQLSYQLTYQSDTLSGFTLLP